MSLKLVSNGTIGNKLVLALVVVWRLTGDKPVHCRIGSDNGLVQKIR